MLVLLALAWVVVLVPSFLAPKVESSPIDGVRSFQRSMGILANTRRRTQVPGRWVMVPKSPSAVPQRRRDRVVRRRRQNFLRLIAAAAAALLIGAIPPLRFFWWAHLVADLTLVLYVVQLRRWRFAELERRRKVRHLPTDRPDEPAVEPAVSLG